MDKKIISFSLYGNNPKYLIGALENCRLAKIIYPGWVCRFYYDKTVPASIIKNLRAAGAEVIDMSDSNIKNGMFWRFLTNDDNVDIWLVRDADSRLNWREKAAVNEWIKSNKKVHIIRDHPCHGFDILGGMWGAKGRIINDMGQAIVSYGPKNHYADDIYFLIAKVFPLIKNNVFIHDDFCFFPLYAVGAKSFPTKRNGDEFVGEVFDQHNIADAEGREKIRAFYQSLESSLFKRLKFKIRRWLSKRPAGEKILKFIVKYHPKYN